MRGEKNQASLGEGAGWAGKAGFGWDHEGLKGVAEKVSDRFSVVGSHRRFGFQDSTNLDCLPPVNRRT